MIYAEILSEELVHKLNKFDLFSGSCVTKLFG
jgi:hypothetical protein